jgi:hypothetical protein
LDLCLEQYSKAAKKREYEWMCFCLDSGDTDVSTNFMKLMEMDKNLKAREIEAFKKIANSKQVLDLTAQLQQQMTKEPTMQEKLDELLKGKKAEEIGDGVYYVQKHSEPYEVEDCNPEDYDEDYDEREDDGDYELYS